MADQIEILVIDGGSTDATREIALRYGATVLEPPHRLPEPAKVIGMKAAAGRYVIEQDTDEEWIRPTQVEEQLQLFARHSEVRSVVCDTQHPGPRGGLAARYICLCGDPFNCFVKRQKKGVYKAFYHLRPSQTDSRVLWFAPGEPVPSGDGGTTMFDLDWVRQEFPGEWDDIRFVCAMTNRIIQRTGCCGCIQGDNIRHHVKAGFATYLSKLRFRVQNNLFHQQESGFSAWAADAVNTRFPGGNTGSSSMRPPRWGAGRQHPYGGGGQRPQHAAPHRLCLLCLLVHRLMPFGCQTGQKDPGAILRKIKPTPDKGCALVRRDVFSSKDYWERRARQTARYRRKSIPIESLSVSQLFEEVLEAFSSLGAKS